MREAFGCGFYPGPDQQPRSNKTVYGNAVWQRLQHQNDLAINNATRSKQEQQQTPTRSRQGHHALGVDGKLLMELLGLTASEPLDTRQMWAMLTRGEEYDPDAWLSHPMVQRPAKRHRTTVTT